MALRGRHLGVGGDQVREAPRAVRRDQGLFDDFLGQSGAPAQLGSALACLTPEALEGRVVGVQRGHVLGLLDDRLEVPLALVEAQRDAAVLAVQQQLDAGEAALQLPDAGDRADREQVAAVRLVGGLPLADGEHQPRWIEQCRFDRFQGARPAGADRHGDAGKQNAFAQRHDGQGQGIGHGLLGSSAVTGLRARHALQSNAFKFRAA